MGLRRSRRHGGLIAVAVGVAASLSACSQAAAPPTGVSTSTLPPRPIQLADGGVVTVAVPYLPTDFNPSTVDGSNRITQMVMQQVWPQAFVTDPEYNPETTGFIDSAELVSISPETIEYDIDPKATWSDGVPISASDFTYNWQQQLAEASSFPSGTTIGYQDISSITSAKNGKTVIVAFTRPFADWEELFANLIPAHIGLQVGWTKGFVGFDPDIEVSGGPFLISSVVPGEELVLSRNPSWWGTPAHLSEIVFKVMPKGTSVWADMAQGTVDMAEVPPGPTVEQEASLIDFSRATTLTPFMWQLVFNLRDPLVSDIRIRRAVAYALDRGQIAADTEGLVDPGVPVVENRIFPIGARGDVDNSGVFSTTDVSKAGLQLEVAGYHDTPSGYFVPNVKPVRPVSTGTALSASGGSAASGKPITLTLTGPANDPLAAEIEAEFQAQMKLAGMMVRIVNLPLRSLLSAYLPDGAYQIALAPFRNFPFESASALVYGGTPTSTGEPPVQRVFLGNGSGITISPVNESFVDSNVMDLTDSAVLSLFSEAESQLNPATDRGLYNEIDTLLWQELPTIPLLDVPVTLVMSHTLINVQESPGLAGPMWNAQDWGIALPPATGTGTTTTSGR
ncbi:MAG TPA: ABC transporter family substrate-binding protein [Acidimicrobiales bacterium]|nr:ABC transporter family substrate-binding protein [Acidimicrobiales bacterium]